SAHWTGAIQGMCGLIRIDDHCYHFSGKPALKTPEMKQVSLEVWPTRTIYHFEQAGVRLKLSFISPLLPHDLDLLSRPITYVVFDVESADARSHRVDLYFDLTCEWAVNTSDQEVNWSRCRVADLDVLSAGSQTQSILAKSGDDLRIDWGRLYLAVP